MFVIELQVAVLRESWLLVLPEADVHAPPQYCMEQMIGPVPSTNQLVLHAVVNVEEIVCILTGILLHFYWKGPAQPTRNYTHTMQL